MFAAFCWVREYLKRCHDLLKGVFITARLVGVGFKSALQVGGPDRSHVRILIDFKCLVAIHHGGKKRSAKHRLSNRLLELRKPSEQADYDLCPSRMNLRT